MPSSSWSAAAAHSLSPRSPSPWSSRPPPRARAGGAGRAGQARVAGSARDDQERSADPGRQPGADPRSDRDKAAAVFRFHADDRARDGKELARGHARAAETADRRVPDAARPHVLGRAQPVPQRDDRLQAAADESRRHRRRRAHAGDSGDRAPSRCRWTTAWRRRPTAGRPTTSSSAACSSSPTTATNSTTQVANGGIDGLIKALADKNRVPRRNDGRTQRGREACRRRSRRLPTARAGRFSGPLTFADAGTLLEATPHACPAGVRHHRLQRDRRTSIRRRSRCCSRSSAARTPRAGRSRSRHSGRSSCCSRTCTASRNSSPPESNRGRRFAARCAAAAFVS